MTTDIKNGRLCLDVVDVDVQDDMPKIPNHYHWTGRPHSVYPNSLDLEYSAVCAATIREDGRDIQKHNLKGHMLRLTADVNDNTLV